MCAAGIFNYFRLWELRLIGGGLKLKNSIHLRDYATQRQCKLLYRMRNVYMMLKVLPCLVFQTSC